ncbi:hypothetical protein RI129_007293 [Pyrocoelia pectoralis]|uniref:Methyltransferase domain-containing protein n=1 Tax=Pyrocoelia pectoralis TaxID=417401 RepID=A0AAN7ZL96_9COLE
MDKAETFIKHNSPAEREAKYAIDKLAQLIPWKDNCNILDIGCGTGNVTHYILLPVFPKSTKNVIGVDNNKSTIEYANKNYGLENKLTFQQVDVVSDSTFFENYEKTFDHIFSFSCLHFVREQETALNNQHLQNIETRGRFQLLLRGIQ